MDVLKYFSEGLRYNLISTEENDGINIIAAFIYWSLERGRQCLYYTDSPIENELEKMLLSYGLRLEELKESGKLVIRSSSEFFLEKRMYMRYFNIVKLIRDSMDNGYRGLSLIADRNNFFESGFNEEENYEYERVLNKIYSEHKVSGFSVYNIDKHGTDTLFNLTRLNPNFIYQMDGQIYVYNETSDFPTDEGSKGIVYAFLKRREKMRKQNSVYQFISHLSGELSYKKDENDIIETGLNSICEAAYAQYGFVVMIRDGSFDTQNIIKYKVPEEIMDMHLKTDFVERCHESSLRGETDCTVYSTDDMREDIRNVLGSYGVISSIVIPIKHNNDILGYMWLATQDKYTSFDDNFDFLFMVCGTIARMLNEYRRYKKIQDSLIQSRKMHALGELSGGIAHEFNNILTPILGYIQILKSKIDDPIYSRYIDLIESSAKDGARIVRRIQDFSRNRKRERELVDIDKAIMQSVEITKPKWTLESQIKNRFININLSLNSGALVEGVPTEVREIFVNLISNSVDAMPNGGHIHISSKNRNGYVIIKLRDSGFGMEKETMERIFEPFYTTKNELGTGLGLSIVYNIVREMGGSIEVESSYGDGTEFIIAFPIKSGSMVERIHSKSTHGMEKYHILVIDDQEPVANAVSEMLKSIGHEADISTEDRDAVEMFKKGDYDCVICDLAMPNYSGTQMSEILRSIKPNVPFILMTGWPGKLKARDLGDIDKVVQKPFSIEEINNALDKVIKNKEATS